MNDFVMPAETLPPPVFREILDQAGIPIPIKAFFQRWNDAGMDAGEAKAGMTLERAASVCFETPHPLRWQDRDGNSITINGSDRIYIGFLDAWHIMNDRFEGVTVDEFFEWVIAGEITQMSSPHANAHQCFSIVKCTAAMMQTYSREALVSKLLGECYFVPYEVKNFMPVRRRCYQYLMERCVRAGITQEQARFWASSIMPADTGQSHQATA
jgi:hypothetical protein